MSCKKAMLSDADDAENSMPRSATMGPMLSSRCVPVCGSHESVKAAYELLIALCSASPLNFRCLVDNLLELFYAGAIFLNDR